MTATQTTAVATFDVDATAAKASKDNLAAHLAILNQAQTDHLVKAKTDAAAQNKVKLSHSAMMAAWGL